VSDEITTFGGRKQVESGGDQRSDVIEAARPGRPEKRFQFREGELDRVEVGTVGREKAEPGPDGFDRAPDLRLFVDGEVVEHHHVARTQRRRQDLFDIRKKAGVVDRPIEHGRGAQAVEAQGRNDRVGLPMPAGRVVAQARAAQTASVAPEQVGRDAAFIQEDKVLRIAERQPGAPTAPLSDDVRPPLLVGVYGFF
jgi:hypothetical protein